MVKSKQQQKNRRSKKTARLSGLSISLDRDSPEQGLLQAVQQQQEQLDAHHMWLIAQQQQHAESNWRSSPHPWAFTNEHGFARGDQALPVLQQQQQEGAPKVEQAQQVVLAAQQQRAAGVWRASPQTWAYSNGYDFAKGDQALPPLEQHQQQQQGVLLKAHGAEHIEQPELAMVQHKEVQHQSCELQAPPDGQCMYDCSIKQQQYLQMHLAQDQQCGQGGLGQHQLQQLDGQAHQVWEEDAQALYFAEQQRLLQAEALQYKMQQQEALQRALQQQQQQQEEQGVGQAQELDEQMRARLYHEEQQRLLEDLQQQALEFELQQQQQQQQQGQVQEQELDEETQARLYHEEQQRLLEEELEALQREEALLLQQQEQQQQQQQQLMQVQVQLAGDAQDAKRQRVGHPVEKHWLGQEIVMDPLKRQKQQQLWLQQQQQLQRLQQQLKTGAIAKQKLPASARPVSFVRDSKQQSEQQASAQQPTTGLPSSPLPLPPPLAAAPHAHQINLQHSQQHGALPPPPPLSTMPLPSPCPMPVGMPFPQQPQPFALDPHAASNLVDGRTKNARKMARKKANKRAREQGLEPNRAAVHNAQQMEARAKAQAKAQAKAIEDKARAVAEAAKNKFAGFEEHTSGIGSKLLEKMGWKRGQGLGSKAQGMAEPVMPKQTKGNKGLGA